MQILTYNLNGIRAALKNGLLTWLETTTADILCFQEVKATPDVVDLSGFQALGYELVGWHAAEKKGYSGVAIFSKIKPEKVVSGCGIPAYDSEGRVIRADFGDITVLNCYFPSGTSGDVRQGVKMRFLADFYIWVNELRKERPNLIICGDYNIAHTEIDIHDPVRNQKSSGFLPEERAWMTKLLDTTDAGCGLVDVYRQLQPDATDACYTWWSNRGQAYANNVGWRLDYHLATPALAALARHEAIYKDVNFSDHAPITVDYDFSL